MYAKVSQSLTEAASQVKNDYDALQSRINNAEARLLKK